MSNTYTSFETSKSLHEAGIEADHQAGYWVDHYSEVRFAELSHIPEKYLEDYYPAYTADELAEMLLVTMDSDSYFEGNKSTTLTVEKLDAMASWWATVAPQFSNMSDEPMMRLLYGMRTEKPSND